MSNTTVVRKAVILTALPFEYVAVQAHLHDLREWVDSDDTPYEIGTFIASSSQWEVCIVEIGMGNEGAALAAQGAIRNFKPEVTFFVGVAGGLIEGEIALGDVVCATKVYGYEFGHDSEHGFKPRPEVGNATYRMVERAKVERRKDKWQERILQPVPEAAIGAMVHVAPIAAGEKTLESARVYTFLRKSFSDAIAVEMEGFGFLLAMHRNPRIDALIIRGISHLIFKKAEEQDKKWQSIAARNASAFAFELLAKLPEKDGAAPMLVEPPAPTTTLKNSEGNRIVSPPVSKNSVQIFFSYVSKDEALVDQLDKHLSMLKRFKGVVTSYAALAGADRMQLLNQADIILLLISPYFVASTDIYEKEVIRAMERREKEGVRVIPVLLRPTADWKLAEFGGLMHIPYDKPVSDYSDKDSAFKTIAEKISAIVTDIRKERGLS